MYTEFEIKFMLDVKKVIEQLKTLHAQQVFKKKLFRRKIFIADFLPINSWVRVRDEGGQVILCMKQDDKKNNIDSIKEYETEVKSFDEICLMLEQMGLKQMMYCENYRELWRYKDCEISIDYWPGLDPFIEIEGNSKEDVEYVVNDLHLDLKKGLHGPNSIFYKKIYNISEEQFKKITELTFDTSFIEFLRKVADLK